MKLKPKIQHYCTQNLQYTSSSATSGSVSKIHLLQKPKRFLFGYKNSVHLICKLRNFFQFSKISFGKKLILTIYFFNRMLHRWACPSQNLPPPLPDDADLGLVEPLSSVSISEDSNQSEFVGTNTDDVRQFEL